MWINTYIAYVVSNYSFKLKPREDVNIHVVRNLKRQFIFTWDLRITWDIKKLQYSLRNPHRHFWIKFVKKYDPKIAYTVLQIIRLWKLWLIDRRWRDRYNLNRGCHVNILSKCFQNARVILLKVLQVLVEMTKVIFCGLHFKNYTTYFYIKST